MHITVWSSVPLISVELVTVLGATHWRRNIRTWQKKAQGKSPSFCNSPYMISNHVRGCYQQAQKPDVCSTNGCFALNVPVPQKAGWWHCRPNPLSPGISQQDSKPQCKENTATGEQRFCLSPPGWLGAGKCPRWVVVLRCRLWPQFTSQ